MTTRQANPRVVPLIVERWSPYSFDESEIPQEDLDVIFEAGGWAPSAYNIQPWKFLYARRGDENWERFLSVLIEFNQSWVKNASALVFVVSDTQMDFGGKKSPNHSHSFDAGAAWALAALQATALGYHTHGMSGVDFDKARVELGIPDDYRLEAAFAVGRRGAPEKLPEKMRDRETPKGRKPISEFVVAGNFR